MKELVGAFNQEKALVVVALVRGLLRDCETDGSSAALVSTKLQAVL